MGWTHGRRIVTILCALAEIESSLDDGAILLEQALVE
jgi:hypothetical protein